MIDRGTDTSLELTEIRTVVNRARSAREKILAIQTDSRYADIAFDPDQAEMITFLDYMIEIGSHWDRTDKPYRAHI